jgi:hemerythrin
MTMAIWNSRYETGIHAIDTQHQALFAAVNDLAESFTTGSSHDKVTHSLAFLARYTQEHFRDEEQLMREIGYPGLASHLDEHARLVEDLQRFQDKLSAGKTITMDVTIFLADWLTHHINDVDMRYVDFFKKQQEG